VPHKNPEQARAYYAAYYASHREERCVSDAAYRAVHRDERATYDAARRATHREEMVARDAAYYAAHREERAAARAAHQKEIAAYNAIYNATHKKEAAVYRAMHLQEHAEKMRRRNAIKRGATIGPIDLAAIKIRDRMICCICGKRVNEELKYPNPYSLSFDHSHPLSLLGPHSQENQRVAHLCCNIRRHTGLLPVQMVLL